MALLYVTKKFVVVIKSGFFSSRWRMVPFEILAMHQKKDYIL